MPNMPLPSLVAIDSPSTRDVDDAIGLARAYDGGWLATVVIADAAAHIPKGSAEDVFAQRQGATVYRRDQAVMTMLPRHISEDRATLKAGSKRKAMVLTFVISSTYEVRLAEVAFKQVTIDAHIPYGQIAQRAVSTDDPLSAMLQEMIGVSQSLLAMRRSHGALAFYDLTRLLYLDEEGHLQQSANREEAIGHILVQEFMVLTNAALAAWAVEHDVPLLYRNHQAKTSAPASADLLTTIHGWLSGSTLNEQTARDQLNLILGTAEYSGGVLGHYALNLPAYAHCTSPLRRFSDLINQRQIAAVVTNKPVPYSRAELDEIAAHLNVVLRERKEERSAGFKETIVRRAARAMGDQRFDRLADHELSQALKLAAESNAYHDGLVNVVTSRIKDGSLSDKVFDRLIEARGNTLPAPIRSAWAAFLMAAPERAKHLLFYGLQTGIFVQFTVNEMAKVSDQFCIEASVKRVSDGQILTARSASVRKKDAEHGATARLILQHFGHEAGEKARAAFAPVITTATATVVNHKGLLLERCQKARWPAPRFEVQMTGPTNDAYFQCTASLVVGGTTFSSDAKGLRNRVAAEQEASRNLLAKLPVLPGKAGGSKPDNPIGMLQERAQRAGQPIPQYSFFEEDGAFGCSVMVMNIKFTAAASTKQDAKAAAARAALDANLLSPEQNLRKA